MLLGKKVQRSPGIDIGRRRSSFRWCDKGRPFWGEAIGTEAGQDQDVSGEENPRQREQEAQSPEQEEAGCARNSRKATAWGEGKGQTEAGQRIKLEHARIRKDIRSRDKDFGFHFKWDGSHWRGDFMFLLLILIIKYYLT